jgi:hypothetical protein
MLNWSNDLKNKKKISKLSIPENFSKSFDI